MFDEETSFFDQIDNIVEREGRYKREAYFFMYSALDHTVRQLKRESAKTPAGRHVSGQELCRGIAEYGREQFGPLVGSVFAHWGIQSTLDFGRIVFTLVDHGLMSKTEEDRLDDFQDVYSFEEVFDPKTIQGSLRELDLERL